MKSYIRPMIISFSCVALAHLTYPVLNRVYGSDLVYIKDGLLLGIGLLLIFQAVRVVGVYYRGTYHFFHAMGLRANALLAGVVRKRFFSVLVWPCVYYLAVYRGDPGAAVLQSITFFLFVYALIFLLLALYPHKIFRITALCLTILYMGYACYTTARALYGGGQAANESAAGLLRAFYRSKGIALFLNFLSVGSPVRLPYRMQGMGMSLPVNIIHALLAQIVLIVSMLTSWRILKSGENRAADMTGTGGDRTRSFLTLRGGPLMHTGSGRVRYFLDHMFRELTVCFRKPVNLFCYLFVYISYAFLLTLCGENKTLFTVFTCAAITLICVGSEEIYRSDVRTNIYYRLFGESYGRFLEKKVLTTALLALVVWLLGAIRAVFLSPAPSASAVFIIPYTLFNILYWNLYDFCRFMHLPESETLPEMTLDLLALAGMFLPVVNLILCVRFYKKGKERWWSES